MPDISEILNEMVVQIASAIYPAGLESPSTSGAPTKIFPGWPDPGSLDQDLSNRIVTISLFPRPGIGKVTTRYSKEWAHSNQIPVPTLTASVDGRTVTFNGVGEEGLIAGIIEGSQSWPLRVEKSWTPDRVAREFKKIVRPGVILDGHSLIFPGEQRLVARTASQVPESRELRRQIKGVQITVWAPSSELRDKTFKAVDLWVASHPFFTVLGSAIRLEYSGDSFDDDGRQANLHRRDLLVSVEYPIIETRNSPPVVIPVVNIVADFGGAVIKTIYP